MCTRVYAYMYVCRCVCLGVFTCLFYVRMRVSVCVYVHTCPGIMYRGGQGQTLNFNWTFLKILFAPQVLHQDLSQTLFFPHFIIVTLYCTERLSFFLDLIPLVHEPREGRAVSVQRDGAWHTAQATWAK